MMVLESLKEYHFPKLRHCLSAGEPLNPEVTNEWWKGTGLDIREGYGQTETVSIVSLPLQVGQLGQNSKTYNIDKENDNADMIG